MDLRASLLGAPKGPPNSLRGLKPKIDPHRRPINVSDTRGGPINTRTHLCQPHDLGVERRAPTTLGTVKKLREPSWQQHRRDLLTPRPEKSSPKFHLAVESTPVRLSPSPASYARSWPRKPRSLPRLFQVQKIVMMSEMRRTIKGGIPCWLRTNTSSS
jgi:hypothetical protein